MWSDKEAVAMEMIGCTRGKHHAQHHRDFFYSRYPLHVGKQVGVHGSLAAVYKKHAYATILVLYGSPMVVALWHGVKFQLLLKY